MVRDAGDRDAKNAVLTDKNPYRDVLVSVLESSSCRLETLVSEHEQERRILG